jgi:hypothetical protein
MLLLDVDERTAAAKKSQSSRQNLFAIMNRDQPLRRTKTRQAAIRITEARSSSSDRDGEGKLWHSVKVIFEAAKKRQLCSPDFPMVGFP